MLKNIQSHLHHFSHLIYPHHCEGCGSDTLYPTEIICAKCRFYLPITNFTITPSNPLETVFYGRLPIQHATAAYFFTKESLIQHLMKQLKYRNKKAVGVYLGKQLGLQLLETSRFDAIDMLIPLPLNPKKEAQRGYNQATAICEGIASVWHKPICTDSVTRKQFTESQTKQNRTERWENMDGVFEILDAEKLAGKHIALVDDVITTGATLEACGSEIVKIPNTKISLLSVAYTL